MYNSLEKKEEVLSTICLFDYRFGLSTKRRSLPVKEKIPNPLFRRFFSGGEEAINSEDKIFLDFVIADQILSEFHISD